MEYENNNPHTYSNTTKMFINLNEIKFFFAVDDLQSIEKKEEFIPNSSCAHYFLIFLFKSRTTPYRIKFENEKECDEYYENIISEITKNT